MNRSTSAFYSKISLLKNALSRFHKSIDNLPKMEHKVLLPVLVQAARSACAKHFTCVLTSTRTLMQLCVIDFAPAKENTQLLLQLLQFSFE